MPGLVIKGKQVEVPELKISNWFDDSRLRLRPGQDCRARHVTWIRNIVLHTSKGTPQTPQELRAGVGPSYPVEEQLSKWWSTSSPPGGAHIVIAADGSIYCLADLVRDTAFHAGQVNEYSIGVEIYQGNEAEIYEVQLFNMVKLLDAITRYLGIQRQFLGPYRNSPIRRLENGGGDVVGIYGHRDASSKRGVGDPGDVPFTYLEAEGYEKFDFFRGLDKVEWKSRQLWLNSRGGNLEEDGIPGVGTVEALKKAGYAHGLWVTRPGD